MFSFLPMLHREQQAAVPSVVIRCSEMYRHQDRPALKAHRRRKMMSRARGGHRTWILRIKSLVHPCAPRQAGMERRRVNQKKRVRQNVQCWAHGRFWSASFVKRRREGATVPNRATRGPLERVSASSKIQTIRKTCHWLPQQSYPRPQTSEPMAQLGSENMRVTTLRWLLPSGNQTCSVYQ